MRGALAAMMALAALAATPAAAQQTLPVPPVTSADRVLGSTEAPVTIITYASFTCPHCAEFHHSILPQIKARYIDSGRARLVYRDLPTNPRPLAEAGAKLARCAAPEAFFNVADALYDGQAAALAGGDPNVWLSTGLRAAGRPQAEVLACFYAPETAAALEASVEAGWAAGVRGTPTVIVDGQLVAPTVEAISAAIEAHPGAAGALP
jgi:protein-disulfide isomerase